jgi:copper chaperone NosL
MMINKGYLVLIAAMVMVVSAGCASGPNLEEPPDIRYGEDVCDRCMMIINEAKYAAAYVTPDGEVRRFDDIGGMAAYIDETPEDTAVLWVHDYDTEEWLKADEAFYAGSEDLATPMGFGIIAFADRERAEEWASEQSGTVRTYSELFE